MADRVIFQDGDDLSEQNLALMLALGNQTNYFERGCGLDVDLNDDTVDIGTTTQFGNLAIVEDANEAYYLLPDKRTGLSLASNDVNYVYIWVDKDDDDTLGYYISTTDAAPTSSDVSADGPIASLKRGEIDTSQSNAADATTEVNPNPAIHARSVDTPLVSTEQIGGERHYAGAYSGSDADARLDNALSAASDDDTIYLEAATYSNNRTISQNLTLVGAGRGGANGAGTEITGDWELTGRPSTLKNCFIAPNNNPLDVSARDITVKDCWISSGDQGIEVTGRDSDNAAPGVLIIGCNGAGSLTFVSGTSGALVDSSELSVTDNGTNTVGDLA
jgi:hypothetical protein